MRHRLFLLGSFLMIAGAARAANEPSPLDTTSLDDATLKVAVSADAAIVGHAGSESAQDKDSWLAIWVERGLKGPLRSGRDIVWVRRAEIPKVELNGAPWLFFLARGTDGAWHVQGSDKVSGAMDVNGPQSATVKALLSFYGDHGLPPSSQSVPQEELKRAIRDSYRTHGDDRNSAYDAIIRSGNDGRAMLEAALTGDDKDAAAVARTLLPLMSGGPEVNGLSLTLEPPVLSIVAGETRTLNASYANVSATQLKIVTGISESGDNLQAASSYEIYPPKLGAKGERLTLQTTMPKNADMPLAKAPMPLTRVASPYTLVIVPVQLRLEKLPQGLRLHFPQGYTDLPAAGQYALRARFEGPGPRADQQRLIDENYWRGGQLVSNEIILDVK